MNDWQIHYTGSVVSLTWPHSHAPLSKSDVESKVLSHGNHSAFDIIFLSINGQKNSLKLMKDFGFLPGWNGTLTQYDGGFSNDRRNANCEGAALMLSDKFWFDNISDSLTKPFRFAGGCIVPPNKLVLKYVSSPQNQTDEKIEKGDDAEWNISLD